MRNTLLQRASLGLALAMVPFFAGVAPAQTAPSTSAATPSVAKPSETSPTGIDTPRPAETTRSAVPPLTVPQQIAKLPALQNPGIDLAAQSTAVLANLNAVLSFYRAAIAPVQKSGEPSDVLYAGQAQSQATQVAQLAFQSAKNESALLAKMGGGTAAASSGDTGAISEAQKLSAFRTKMAAQLADLQKQQSDLTTQLQHATAKDRPGLLQRQEQLQGELELQQATVVALARINTFSEAQAQSGLAADIDRLQRSVPELAADSSNGKSVPPQLLESLSEVRQSGVTTQASALFSLLSTRHAIDNLIADDDRLRTQANALRTPFVAMLRSTLARGQQLSQQTIDLTATPTTDAQDRTATRQQFDQLTATFQALSDAMLPLSQEIVLLETERGTLASWRNAVDVEYHAILRTLLIRLALIAGALGLLLLISTLWGRATVRYVSDLRRRRQLLLIRRIVIGFVGGMIVIFGFITQFSSLATFAGFITAGIAVGLQTILLSVAAYFFIIGRYGVRVGDRITVAGVTGDVVEVGLVRFYMMELAGTGTELHSTGRVAVFANSVLFQTGTPLYKQMPGTEYAWHELVAKLKPEADVEAVRAELEKAVTTVYAGYQSRIEAQHREVETWMGAAIGTPAVSSRLQMIDGTPQIVVLFPVELNEAAETDQKIIASLMRSLNTEGPLKAGLAAPPSLNAAIKS